jgi:prepilin-type processing-associated H-X9-DG protein
LNTEYPGNGLFFDSFKNDVAVPISDSRELHPRISVKLGAIADGSSKTLLLSENVHTFYRTYDLDANGDQNDSSTSVQDVKHLFGFVWATQQGTSVLGRINGELGLRHPSVTDFAPTSQEKYGYPSSNHTSGVNVSFCDGHVEFLAETIDPQIYAQLMTSNAKRSTLVWNNTKDSALPPPPDDKY